MKKLAIQLILMLCIVIESLLIFIMITTSDTIYQELYTGLAIITMLIIIRLTNNLTDITYGNHEKN